MADLAKLVVSLEAQTAKYQRGLDKANNRLKRFETRQKKSLKAITRGFQALGAAVVAVRFQKTINDSIDFADRIGKLNDRLGISVEALSELSFAASQSGVEFNQLALGLQRLSRRVGEAAQGTGEAKAALKELRLDASKLAQLPLETQFEIIGQRLSEVAGDSDRLRLAFKLFDAEGTAVLQAFKDGAAGIQAYRDEARKLGRSLSEDQVDAAVKAKDALDRLDTSFSSFTDRLVLNVVPAITSFSEALRIALFGSEIEKAQRKVDNLSQQLGGLVQTIEIQGFVAPAQVQIIDELSLKLRNAVGELNQLKENARSGGKAVKDAFNEANEDVTLDKVGKKTEKLDKSAKGLRDTLNDLFGGWLVNLSRTKGKVEEVEEEVKKLDDTAVDLGFAFQSSFEDAILEGEKLSEVLKGLLRDIAQIAIRSTITKPLGDFVAGAFQGFFADGGSVVAGRPAVVGEAGPELFVPRTAGTIIPNGGGMGGSVTVNNYYSIERDAELREFLPGILENNRQKTIAEIQAAKQQGRF